MNSSNQKWKTSLEILEKNTTNLTGFSIIIGNLQGMIPTDCIQAKVYKQHPKTGKMEFLPSGCPMSMYASPDMYEKDIRQYPVEKFMTPQDKYNYLKDHQKRACDLSTPCLVPTSGITAKLTTTVNLSVCISTCWYSPKTPASPMSTPIVRWQTL